MEGPQSKRDKLLASCRHYKEVVKKWEVAIQKTEGRKPGKGDIKTAPENVQKAYTQYKKLEKYLQTHEKSLSNAVSPRRKVPKVGISPQKIFAIRSSESIMRRNTLFNSFPSRRNRKSNDNPATRFALKISSAVSLLEKSASRAKEESACSSVENDTIVESSTVDQTSFTSPSRPKTPSGVNGCVMSAVWQNLTPSPKAKRRKTNEVGPVGFKHVDSGWLARGDNDTQNEKETEDEHQSPLLHDTSDEILNVPAVNIALQLDEFSFEDDDTVPATRTEANTSLFAPEFQNFLKSASETSPKETSVQKPSFSLVSVELNETQSGDSGIGMPAVNSTSSWEHSMSGSFSGTEPMDAVFHNEDACFPPPVLQTIDMNAISSIFTENSLAQTYQKETSSSQSNPRKRTSIEAFSPSPKKPSPKKKFFKSDRSKLRDVRYSAPTFKPLSPVKKRKTVTSPAAIKTKTVKSPTASSAMTQVAPAEASVRIKSKKSSEKISKASGKESKEVPKPDDSNYFDEGVTVLTNKRKGYRSKLSGKAALERKLNTGKVNENFVKIDLKKKVFVRGHKKVSGSKMKRTDWKLKKAASSKEEILSKMKCRKCGEAGHFARFCVKDLVQKEEPDEIDESPFPTLEEAANMLKGQKNVNVTKVNIYSSQDLSKREISATTNADASTAVVEDTGDLCDEELDSASATIPPVDNVQPYFEVGSTLEDEEAALEKALKKFGYDEFRSGQKEAITRVLKGLSTMVILSTGSGKSLCYQLPAYLYAQKNPGALAICVSPLVSLMEDQVQGLPDFLQAACIHSNMPAGQKEKVIEKIRSKKLQILLVSPEAVCGGLFGLLRSASDIPLISFACIDEVHCLSQWSHNFRPCYLQLTKILREKLNVTTILGLTATATDATASSVCRYLRINPDTTIRGEIFPKNLNLSVSRDTFRDEALMSLLRGERFKECDSIIIYCTRREECERLSTLIRTCLQGDSSSKMARINARSQVSTACEAYHAGMSAYRRKVVQQHFMAGKIRIVVATVAFGMGIDKSDIRSVIHYNMPKTFESYVQEIGRAGRDGLPAHCHLFLENAKGKDLSELRRHVYSNSVDRPILRKLIRKVFQPCKCARLKQLTTQSQLEETIDKPIKKRCPGHEVSFVIADTVEDLDLPQENILTLLCYMELNEKQKWIEMLPNAYQTCKIHSYGGAKLLKSAALKSPPLAAAIALAKEKKRFKDSDSYLEFNVIEVASTLGWNSGTVKRELKGLEWTAVNFDTNGASSKFRKSAILVEFADLAFHLNAPGDLTDEEADKLLDYLHKLNKDQEKAQLYQLNRVFQSLLSVSCAKADSIVDGHDEEKSKMLKHFICEYFAQSNFTVPVDWKNDVSSGEDKEEQIRRDTVMLLASSKDCVFTGRSVAKIFQGIPSPNYPAMTWGRNRAFWRKYIDVDFNFLCQIAGQEIIQYR